MDGVCRDTVKLRYLTSSRYINIYSFSKKFPSAPLRVSNSRKFLFYKLRNM